MSKSATTIDPIHPGVILEEEFLVEHGITASALAVRLGVPRNRITRIVNGQSSITAATAVLLARALGTTPEFWMNLQSHYDLDMVKRDAAQTAAVARVCPIAVPEVARA